MNNFEHHIKTYFVMFNSLIDEADVDDIPFMISKFDENIDFIPIAHKGMIESEIDFMKYNIVKKIPSFNIDITYYSFKELEDEAKISIRNQKIKHVLRS